MDRVVLHHSHIDEILNWTKEHLDAYLASADVIIEQRDEPSLAEFSSLSFAPNWVRYQLGSARSALKELSFSPGEVLSADNGLGFYRSDFALDNDLDAWLIELQMGCGLH
jgi:hypothetical protein